MEDGGHNVIKARRFRMVDDCVVDPLCARLRRRGAGRLGGRFQAGRRESWRKRGGVV